LGSRWGALWPRRATPIKLVILVGWVALAAVGESHLPAWVAYWNPTSYSLAGASETQLIQQSQAIAATADRVAVAQALPMRLPAMQPWLLPHLGLIVVGIGLAVIAAAGFRRFRDVL